MAPGGGRRGVADLNIDDRTPMEQAAENVVAKRPLRPRQAESTLRPRRWGKEKSHEQEAQVLQWC